MFAVFVAAVLRGSGYLESHVWEHDIVLKFVERTDLKWQWFLDKLDFFLGNGDSDYVKKL